MIETFYFGQVTIEYWEYLLMFFYFVVVYIYFARQKNLRIKTNPEYRFFLWGLFAKIVGGVFFSLIYFYYYQGGDTTSYFYSAVAMGNLARVAPMDYLTVLFGENTPEVRDLFTLETGRPLNYVFKDPRAYMVVRLVSPFTLLTFNSYLLTTTLIASITFIPIWRCYTTFVRYYPSLAGPLAVAVLFMPSSIFWGSAILKDTFTFSSVCLYFHSVDNIFFRKRDQVSSVFWMLVSSFVMVAIKPYIFMALFPVTLLWISYNRLSRIRNALIKYLLVPVGFAMALFLSFYVLVQLGERLDKFSLDKALDTIMVSQQDMKRTEEYGDNFFDIGELDGTWGGVLSKFHIATSAALFRPFITECNNFVMYLAGLENLYLLLFALSVLIRSRIVFFPSMVTKNALLMMCVSFTLTYAFITGVTTPNFGALVRFKIPLIPFFVASMAIMRFQLEQRRRTLLGGKPFRWDVFADGEPRMLVGKPGKRRRMAMA